MKNVGIVIPTKNAYKELRETIPKIRETVPEAQIFIMDDRSSDGTPFLAKDLGCIIPFCFKKRGYGKSYVEGLAKAFYEYNCKYVIAMDADHTTTSLRKMVSGLRSNKFDMIIGVESGRRASRSVAGFLARRFLGLKKFRHPTCGLVGFTNKSLKHLLAEEKIKSNNDFVHVELVYKANRLAFRFGEVEFSGEEHEKHRITLRRIIRWLWSFNFLFLRRITTHLWKNLYKRLMGDKVSTMGNL